MTLHKIHFDGSNGEKNLSNLGVGLIKNKIEIEKKKQKEGRNIQKKYWLAYYGLTVTA